MRPDPTPWSQVYSSANVTISQRVVPDSPLREMRVEAVLDAPLESVREAIHDANRYSEWMPFVAETRIVETRGDDTRSIYQRVCPPLISNRDYTVTSTRSVDLRTGGYVQAFEVNNEVGPPPQDGVVRVQKVRGRWCIDPLDDNKTSVRYWVHTDPGGYIPAWIVNYGARQSMPKLFRAIERRARDLSEQAGSSAPR